MTNAPSESAGELRRRAEQKLEAIETVTPETVIYEDMQQILHELRVHQAELEMQNEELRRSQQELGISRARYYDLFDLAPVGYLAFNNNGLIQEANLAAASMFGVIRTVLLQNLISPFIFPEDLALYALNRQRMFDSGELQSWEMRLIRADGTPFRVDMQATTSGSGGYLMTFADISAR